MDEKVSRFNSLTSEEKSHYIVEEAYGNLPVDIPMLGLSEKQFCVTKGRLSVFKH